jgi:hypothetical protein
LTFAEEQEGCHDDNCSQEKIESLIGIGPF